MKKEKTTLKLIEYSSNNSGGVWWLTKQNWKDLEAAGWEVKWRKFLGSAAQHASKRFESIHDAEDEFSSVTGRCPDDEGCECCGPPHNFSVIG